MQTTFPAIYEYISQSNLKNSSLQNWLSRLALMHPNAKEVDTGLYVRVLSYLQLAEKNTIFRE
ncbi:MAG: hypothetical protein FJZ57_00620 [Chlamydiae bacterium]|nr:hypothetical protein [Chlamydiota bacterium]